MDKETAFLARDFQKPFHAVDVLVEFFEKKRELEFVERLVVGIYETRNRRIVYVAFGFVFFERLSEVVGHFEPPGIEKQSAVYASVGSFDDGAVVIDPSYDVADGLQIFRRNEVGLVHYDHVREFELFDHGFHVFHELGREVRGIDHTDDAVEPYASVQILHEKTLRYRERFRHSGRFDDDPVDMPAAGEQTFDGIDEIFPDDAADAPAVDFDDFLARDFDKVAVYAFGSELVFDDGDFLIRKFSEEMVEEGSFSTSEETGEYGDGNRGVHGYFGQFGQTGTWISFFDTVPSGSESGWTSDTWPQE